MGNLKTLHLKSQARNRNPDSFQVTSPEALYLSTRVAHLSIYFPFFSISIYPAIYLPIYLSFHLSTSYLSISLSICLSICWSMSLCSIYLSIYLSIYRYVCLSRPLFLSLSAYVALQGSVYSCVCALCVFSWFAHSFLTCVYIYIYR